MPKFFKTIRWKLTLSFLLAFGIMIIVFSVVIYNIEEFQYRKSMDNAMNVLAGSINDEIQSDGIKPEALDETKETYVPFSTISQHYAELTDSSGNIILKSTQLGNSVLPIKSEQLSDAVKGLKQIYTVRDIPPNSLWDKSGLRILYYPVNYKGRLYIIVIGIPKTNIEASLYNLRLMYIFSIPMMLLLASIIGWFFSKMAYGPVKQLIVNANLITAENLSERLPVNESGDELAQLAVTLNKMIERLESSFNTLKQFASDASHELRTPLTILRGQIEVAFEKERSPGEYKKSLEDNLDEVKRLQSIVDELLLLSQLESGRFKINKDEINICELLTESVSKSDFLAKKKNIKIILSFDLNENLNGGQPIVMGDHASLQNVFLNILENAVKYSPENSEINCKLSTSGQNITVSVRDKGIGIKPDDIEKIFNRFYRADVSRTRSDTKESSISLGLGLSIAKKVIELLKGKISVNSKPGEGAEFIITLPAV